MIYELKNKNNDDVIDVVNTNDFGLNEAKIYFAGRKKLDEEQFDKLFIVNEKPTITKHLKYDWWEEERTTLDIEK
tara:strand:- start:3129 stop:3353 length:225 start_codon:yes stop_codon:yes gene_type:complete